MKLLPATSFFLFVILITLSFSESSEIYYQENTLPLSILKDTIDSKVKKRQYDSVIFYGLQLREASLSKEKVKFVQYSNNKLSRSYHVLKEYDSAIYYGHEFLKLAVIHKDTQSMLKAYNKLRIYHLKSKTKDSTLYFIKKQHTLSVIAKDSKNIAQSLYRKGMYYKYKDSLVLAYENLVRSKNLYVKTRDSLNVATTLIDLSTIEKKLGDLASSQLSALNGLTYISDPKNIVIRSKLYYNIAVAAKEQGDLVVAERRINEALFLTTDTISNQKIKFSDVTQYFNTKANILKEKENYNEAVEIYKGLLNDTLYKLPLLEEARINGNLAHTLFLKKGFNKESITLLNSSLNSYKEKKYNSGLISIYMKLAELYREKNKQKAIFYTDKAIEHARNLNNKFSLYEGLQNKILLKSNEKDNAEYISIELEIEKNEDKMQSQFANAKYDFEKAEKERIKAENTITKIENAKILIENRQRKSENFILILLLILVVLILMTFFIYQKIKRRHKIEKVKTIHNTEVRISTKVHDELANDIHYLLAQLETSDPDKEAVLDRLDIIYNNARDISKQNRSVETGEGFPDELTNLFRSYQSDEVNVILKRYDIDIWNGISSHVKITLYRVLQELLTNMKKHSNATLVAVSIEKYKKELFVQFKDNGKGFSEGISKNGLLNAENRIHAIKGKLTFDTELHQGCKFSINVPL